MRMTGTREGHREIENREIENRAETKRETRRRARRMTDDDARLSQSCKAVHERKKRFISEVTRQKSVSKRLSEKRKR